MNPISTMGRFMRYVLSIIATLAVASAFAAVTIVETPLVTLRLGSATKATHPTMEACEADARARIKVEEATRTTGTSTYLCRDERLQLVATFSVSPPTCPPLPSPETRSQTCPAGTIGTWTQTRTYTAAPAPTCSTAGEWLPTSPPAGACTPTPPPSGDTIRHGQPFTVTGSNFGTKASAAPLAFDDFEAGAAGATVPGKAAVVGRWLSNDYCTGITYGTHDSHKVAKHTFAGGTYNASLCVDPAPTTTVYLDFWAKGVPRGNPSRNWKVWRFYSASDADVGNLVYYCGSGGVQLGGWTWLAEVPPPIGWVHYEVIQRPGGSRHYRNGKLDSSSTGAPSVAQIRIGHYWGLDSDDNCGSNPGGDVYTDDVYVDNSVARVVLANAATFDGSTKRQVQRATAWAAGEAKIIGNTRGFAVGEKAFVLVMDAGNVQRQSLPVTVQ